MSVCGVAARAKMLTYGLYAPLLARACALPTNIPGAFKCNLKPFLFLWLIVCFWFWGLVCYFG